MTVPALLAELRSRDIHVWADNDQLRVSAPAGALTPDLREQLRQRKDEILEFLCAPAELSFAQQRLWFLDQLETTSSAYLIPCAFRIQGPLQVEVLQGALASIVARHESLRTTIVNIEGSPFQKVSAVAPQLLRMVDLRGEPHRLGALINEEMQRGFSLALGPLFRSVLYRLGLDDHALLLLQHHIVSDAWSVDLMLQELQSLYRDGASGRAPSLQALPMQYRDFSRWQRERLQGAVLDRQLEYWRSALAGAPQVLPLPTDRQRPPLESHRGATHSFTIPREVNERLEELARREGATLFMVLMAAFNVLLLRYTGQEDLLVGMPVANRGRRELEGLIGLFLNTLVLRTDLSGNPTVREMLARVRERCLDAYAHQELPLEMLVEDLRPPREPSRNPLFQVMLVLQNEPERPFALPGLTVAPITADRGAAQLDLTLYAQRTPHGLRGTFEFATDLFDSSTIERMAQHWRVLLEALTARPESRLSELPLLTHAERHQLVVDFNKTGNAFPRETLMHQLFEAQVQHAPERTAVKTGATTLSYAQLDARAARIAQVLRARGMGHGERVGLCLERGADKLAALLGILKSGAAYVPLDPAFPQERLRFMAEDAGIALLVSTSALAGLFVLPRDRQLLLDADAEPINAAPSTAVPVDAHSAQPEDPAYVIYTSGSTGRPKGVVVPHRAVVNFLTSMAREPGLAADDVLVAVTTLSFDIAVLELQLPLAVGATAVIASREEALDGQILSTLLEQHRATVMQATPATWRLLLEAGWTPRIPFKALIGGEALPKDLADQLIARGVELWNMYGPTETTVWSTCSRIADTTNGIIIGKPIANTTVYILDANKNLCPIGVPGELCIGGDGVTLGYWNRPELTAERFVSDPFGTASGARLYRTGDRARWRNDGTLEHLGRLDDQVKVRGFRIELGEIEAVLAEHPDVRQAAVRLWTVKANDVRMVACCVPTRPGVLAPASLRKHLRARLPEHMIPQHFLPVEKIPLTPNGKFDRNRLPTPAVEESSFQQQHEAPADTVEATIAEIWANLIGPARPIGRADKFFEMGGHSLLALRALRQIEQKLAVKVDLRALFQDSVAEIATRCRSAQPQVHTQL